MTTWGRELRGSDKSEQKRTVVEVEIPITGRVPMVTGIDGDLQTRKPYGT